MFCTQPTISSSLIVHSTNIFLTIKLGTFLIFYQTLLLHLSVYKGGSVGGAPNAQKAFVQTVLGFCKAPKGIVRKFSKLWEEIDFSCDYIGHNHDL